MLGARGQVAVEAETVIDGVATQAALGTREVGAAQVDGAERGEEVPRANPLVAAGMSPRAGARGSPFFSSWSICCWRVAAKESRRTCRP